MTSIDRDYYKRHAELERAAARRSQDPRMREIHEHAAQLYEALAAKAEQRGNKA